MVLHAIDPIEMAVFVGEQMVNKSQKSFFLRKDNSGFPVLRGKNDVVD
ncbi:hypothetical protein C943_03059 [Mariniradius saccharolyticus AK6]|jgi:hypothetical protein|uniref:Uncharacterized protein n=1 Tax=Mariniradius saccharolyticus AK6 TaxID=1239962 RepID=M7YDB5_9BACT|nr:hypothetical protein C943_03059 [Mariniradius saccharolyticus AK6]